MFDHVWDVTPEASLAMPSRGCAGFARASVSCLWQLEIEGGAPADLRGDTDRAAPPAHGPPADVQPEAGAARNGPVLRVGAVELLEHRLVLAGGDAHPLVAHLDAHAGVGRRGAHLDRAAVRGVLTSVVDQVHEPLLDPVRVAKRRRAVPV